jgi:hypothetical protein
MKSLSQKEIELRKNSIGAYVAAGFSLFACNGPDDPYDWKAPAKKGWQSTPYDSNLTADSLPLCYGVVIPPGVIILDRDVRYEQDGINQLEALYTELGIVTPETFRVRTGGGGEHVYLRVPKDFRAKSKVPGFPAVDIKQHGGYVIACGSLHKNGNFYTPVAGTL